MRSRIFGHAFCFVGLVALCVGCGANGSHGAAVSPLIPTAGGTGTGGTTGAGSTGGARGTLSIRIVVSTTQTDAHHRFPAYISASTKSAVVSVTSTSGATNGITINCTSVCSGSVGVPAGLDTISVSLYDGTGGTGKLLSSGTMQQQVSPGTTTTVNLTENPVLSSYTLPFPATPAITAGVPSSFTVPFTAYDPDGNIIIGSGSFIDSSGAPVVITPMANSQPANTTAFTFTPATITTPVASVTVNYTGAALTSFTLQTGGAPTTVTTPAPVAVPSAVISVPTPVVTTLPSGNPSLPNNPVASVIATASDGGIWVVGNGSSSLSTMLRIDPVTYQVTSYTIPFPADGVTITRHNAIEQMTLGPDGNLWFAGYSFYGKVTPAGQITTYGNAAFLNDTTTTANAFTGVAFGSDGNLYIDTIYGPSGAGGNDVEVAPATGSASLVPNASGITDYNYGRYATTGVDGNVYFTSAQYEIIFEANIAQHVVTIAYNGATQLPSAGQIGQISTGPDGNLWLTDANLNSIDRYSPTSGTMVRYPIPTASADPVGIIAARDGNLYFGESGTNKIGQINPSTGAIKEFTVTAAGSTANNGNYFTDKTGPMYLTEAHDGSIWFTSGYGLGRFVY